MDEPVLENEADAGGVVAAVGGDGDEAAIVATAPTNQGNGGGVVSSENPSGNGNATATAPIPVPAAAPPARYSLRRRKPLMPSAQGNTEDSSAAAASGSTASGTGDSNSSNSAVPPPDPFGYINAAILTDRQFEKLLAKHEEDGVRQRHQNKLRLERGYCDDDYPYVPPPEGCPPFHSLPKEAIQLVFELLPSARAVLCLPVHLLPKEAIQLVFELLPSARAVFALAFQSKHMLSFVEERPDIVVRAAVIGGSNDETKTLRVIMNQVRSGSIHVPSVPRLSLIHI